jgi:CheY-like chemotaxis protein
LIVDDSEADQFICQHMIKAFDPSFEILTAFDGEQAIEVLKKSDAQPDIIFLDINMPNMNGFEFLEEYQKQNLCGNIIVMLSSSSLIEDRKRLEKYDYVYDYKTKPLDIEYLQRLFDNLN